jgi:hypothetical protein
VPTNPPATRTVPSGSSVAEWESRAVCIEPVGDHAPVWVAEAADPSAEPVIVLVDHQATGTSRSSATVPARNGRWFVLRNRERHVRRRPGPGLRPW